MNMAYVCALLCVAVLVPAVRCQYEHYSAEDFPHADLMPLDSAYGFALERYGARDWVESARYLELSLRLHRLLKESEARCSRACTRDNLHDTDTDMDTDTSLQIIKHILTRAACVKKCKAEMAVFSKKYPNPETLEAFGTRTPYRYLQFAYYQTLFLKAVLLYNAGDFSRSVRMMEEVCVEYLRVYDECVSACEGLYEVQEVKDFYHTLAGFFMEVMRCKVRCEEDLTPNVGGFFVEKFVATIYHYMQFAYYKLNDVIKAAPCALSYLLFDPDDQVMQQNVAYYKFHRKQWGLREEEFKPRPEALRYFNQTTKQKELLEFAHNYLQTDDEDVVSSEESPALSSPDEEFDGVGDYEESFLAEWWQEPKTKGDTGEAE
ncbi:endoplasmic reticulum protein SC65 isoform X2 [Pangasianodon hypophthalmus]|uniref:endoplasmic reticulum protein SC65 isoform X2 n=1 Tax=Pangasianodon hypophthalmus TaxID=310915 RepID=UPI00147A0107|nr:endoplasmic reticulum protein SC65 isoform X2 [Pangasianodon hypophthalmus]